MSRRFRFKQFALRQDRNPMKVGTDGVLLGAWADVSGARRILDTGTGTGLIALMMAQRAQNATVIGMEPLVEACGEARENVAASPFADRVEVVCCALADYTADRPLDLVICNPPFFGSGPLSPDAGRAAARHAATLTPEALAAAAERLAPRGRTATIYPPEGFERLRKAMEARGMSLVRRTDVRPNPQKPVHRTLSEFKAIADGHTEVSTLNLYTGQGARSKEFAALTDGFYL